MKALAGLAVQAAKFFGGIAIDLGKEWWENRKAKKKRAGLSHLDSERQVKAAREAGPIRRIK